VGQLFREHIFNFHRRLQAILFRDTVLFRPVASRKRASVLDAAMIAATGKV